ncbi:hypothetical protein ABID29_001203 [Streptococcus rupicaprae]|uniref:Uncharacterized protein n=1 Tax=Streptococcus rupicaprae TaxID=759619 RepID=A0ABV2FHV9_9STRE
MKIGVIQASTGESITDLLFNLTCQSVGGRYEVFNLGTFHAETQISS